MSDINFSKTGGRVLLAHTQLATATMAIGSWLDVSTYLAARMGVSLGRTNGTALTNEVTFRLQGSLKDSGDDEAFDIYAFTSATGKTAGNSTTLSAGTSAGATTFGVASATGIAAGSKLYLRETGTPGDSEWCEVLSISGTTVTPVDALTRAHTSGITVTTRHERWAWSESLAGIKRIRLIVDAATSASGQTVDVIAWAMTLDKAVST